MILDLVYYANPLLRTRSTEVAKITDEIHTLIQDMIETMDAKNGIGLAAVQIGKPIRLFIARSYIEQPDGSWAISAPQVYINPQLSEHSTETIEDEEGCLSIPGLKGTVVRPLKLTIEALDQNGKSFIEHLEGYNARIRMHENDHLNGVLFIDRLDIHAKHKLEPFLQEIKKNYPQE